MFREPSADPAMFVCRSALPMPTDSSNAMLVQASRAVPRAVFPVVAGGRLPSNEIASSPSKLEAQVRRRGRDVFVVGHGYGLWVSVASVLICALVR